MHLVWCWLSVTCLSFGFQFRCEKLPGWVELSCQRIGKISFKVSWALLQCCYELKIPSPSHTHTARTRRTHACFTVSLWNLLRSFSLRDRNLNGSNNVILYVGTGWLAFVTLRKLGSSRSRTKSRSKTWNCCSKVSSFSCSFSCTIHSCWKTPDNQKHQLHTSDGVHFFCSFVTADNTSCPSSH